MKLFSVLSRKKTVSMDNYFSELRNRMVQEQIKSRGIKDEKILDIFRKIPRHLFIPEKYWNIAYEDHPVPIGNNQTISQPYIVALMTEALGINSNDKILEIGTGSGYQTAILAELISEIYSIEYYPELADQAKNILSQLGYKRIKIKSGDGFHGWEEYIFYDKIIVTCAPSEIPELLLSQLNENGRMVIPVGSQFSQDLLLIQKKNGRYSEKSIAPVIFVPMLHRSEMFNN